MKTSEAGNKILPNSFQHPNFFVDELMYLLTPEENIVLTFAIRRILGFQDNISSRKDNISLSQFVDGIMSTKDGSWLSHGCGLGTSAVRRALANLETYKILIPTTEKPNPKAGQEYWLQESQDAINWKALADRDAENQDKERKRTEKARYVVAQKTVAGQQPKDTVGQQPKGLSDNNTKPTETQGNPDLLINGGQPETPITENTDEEAERMKYDLLIFQVSPNHRGYFDEFYRLTKLLPEGKKQLKEWIDACSALWSAKVEVKDMEQAFRAQLEANFSIKNPGSLLATMQTIKMRRENGIQIKPKQNIARKVKDDLTAAFEQYGKEQGFI
jgi:hypothetical protein